MFFSFDGIDGVGKSTQMQLFCDFLSSKGHDVLSCRDPGSTPLGEKLREILLHSDESTPICCKAEMLIYMAARAQLVEEIILPALKAGKTVVSDRYVLANVVYQSHAGGLNRDDVQTVGKISTSGLMPDMVFLLDMPLANAKARLNRSLDRMENQTDEYMEKLHAGFLSEAAKDPKGIAVINADQSIEAVQQEILNAVSKVL